LATSMTDRAEVGAGGKSPRRGPQRKSPAPAASLPDQGQLHPDVVGIANKADESVRQTRMEWGLPARHRAGPIIGIALIQIHRLLDRTSERGMRVRRGTRGKNGGRRAENPASTGRGGASRGRVAVTVQRAGRIHQARERPLGFLPVVGRQGDVADRVFHALELAKRALKRDTADRPMRPHANHLSRLPRRIPPLLV